jgi:hypothetical protein
MELKFPPSEHSVDRVLVLATRSLPLRLQIFETILPLMHPPKNLFRNANLAQGLVVVLHPCVVAKVARMLQGGA